MHVGELVDEGVKASRLVCLVRQANSHPEFGFIVSSVRDQDGVGGLAKLSSTYTREEIRWMILLKIII